MEEDKANEGILVKLQEYATVRSTPAAGSIGTYTKMPDDTLKQFRYPPNTWSKTLPIDQGISDVVRSIYSNYSKEFLFQRDFIKWENCFCWKCGHFDSVIDGVIRRCSCGGWFVRHDSKLRNTFKERVAELGSVDRVLVDEQLAISCTNTLFPRFIPASIPVKIVSVRNVKRDTQQYIGVEAASEGLSYVETHNGHVFYSGVVDPTRWSTTPPKRFDSVEVVLLDEVLVDEVEDQISSVLDDIDDRFLASRFSGPDPIEVLKLRVRLALAEVIDHDVSRSLECFCSLENPEKNRETRHTDAAGSWDVLEEYVLPGSSKRTAVVLRAARACLEDIKSLPSF